MLGKAPALSVAIVCCSSWAAAAGPFTFTGAGATPSWTDAGNWSGGAVPPGDGSADVAIAGGSALNLDGSRSVHALAVSAGGRFTIAAGSVAGSFLLVSGGSITRSARGTLDVQVPLVAPGPMSLAGFEPQTALSTSSALVLRGASWPSGTAIANLVVSGTPQPSGVALPSGAWLDLAGSAAAIGSLSGAGSVTNTSATAGALLAGLDGTDTSFSGALGAKFSDQAAAGPFDLVKLGPGMLTLTGTSNPGGAIRVIDGALAVNGTLTGAVTPAASSATHGTLRGTGTVGAISTAGNVVPGATVFPGTASARGILHAASADLRHGTLQVRLSAYKTAGADYDQLVVNAGGTIQFDGDSELVLDLAGLAATGGPVNVAVFPKNGSPAFTFQPQQIRLLNNAGNFAVTVGLTVDHVTVTVKAGPAVPLFAVTPAHGLVTSESGGRATFTVALGKAPTAQVTLPVASSNPAEGTVAPSSLTFTTANWNVPQQVTVTGVDDSVPDGPQAYSIALGPAASADAAFSGQPAPAVGAVNLDDDLITLSPSTMTTAPPPDAPQSATLTFHAANGSPLWIVARPQAVAVTPPAFTVVGTGTTPAPQVLALSGPHQLDATCLPSTLAFAPVISADPLYDGYEIPSLPLCNSGDHAPVAQASSFAVDAGGTFSLQAPGLLAGARDPDLDPISARVVSAPAHGALTLSADGSVNYVPAAGFSGADSFAWVASDTALDSAPAVVSVSVGTGSAVPGAPAARLACAVDGDLRPGGAAVFTVSVQDTGAADLSGAVLRVTPTGLALDGAVEGAELAPSGFALPLVSMGSSREVRLHGHVTAGRFAKAGASAQLFDASGAPLGDPAEAFRDTQPLTVSVGGCASFPSGWALLGLAVLLRRRRPTSPRPACEPARRAPAAPSCSPCSR